MIRYLFGLIPVHWNLDKERKSVRLEMQYRTSFAPKSGLPVSPEELSFRAHYSLTDLDILTFFDLS